MTERLHTHIHTGYLSPVTGERRKNVNTRSATITATQMSCETSYTATAEDQVLGNVPGWTLSSQPDSTTGE